jgi:RAB protein geranylgeranyltransferase component A
MTKTIWTKRQVMKLMRLSFIRGKNDMQGYIFEKKMKEELKQK